MPSHRYRMVALDIDGTLVNYHEEASPKVIDAVRQVVACGAHVVLSTGKSMIATQSIVHLFGLKQGWCVASNGAVTFSYLPFEVTRTVTFDPRPIAEAALRKNPRLLIGVEAIGHGNRVSSPFPDNELAGVQIVEPLENLISAPTTRLLVRDSDAPLHDFDAYAPEGVCKATSLAVLAESLGLGPQDVLAIGDGHNDITMLRWAGRGVAMGHAAAEVKAAADDVTSTLDDDGVATELLRWF